MAKHRTLSKQLKNRLLVEANHVCTICGRSGVQIHHIDGDLANNAEDNLIVLCLLHHDEAERSKASHGLSNNLDPESLQLYKCHLKNGYRAPPIRPESSEVSANVRNVEDSQIVIALGDVTVFAESSTELGSAPHRRLGEEHFPTEKV